MILGVEVEVISDTVFVSVICSVVSRVVVSILLVSGTVSEV